jgi:D-3-phosphoglycerate dehydrogenase
MSDAPRVVVVADPIDGTAIARLRAGPCTLVDASAEPARLKESLADAWGLVVRSRTKVDRALLAVSPQLKLVARAGVGVDNVDLAAAAEHGVEVVNAPTAATTSVAELTLAFYLMLVRGLYPKIVSAKSGAWERGTHGHELYGRTVGFVGYGRIAREVAGRLVAFGAAPVAYDPFLDSQVDRTELLSLDRLLERADIVSLHAALTPQNHHLIDAAALARMQRGSYLVNVARGALVDESALLSALDSGQLGGVAMDVFETEPPTDARLLAHPRVLATPHLGASTHEAQERAGRDVVDEVLRALRGEPRRWVVAPPGRAA